jgi:hypothetical protein
MKYLPEIRKELFRIASPDPASVVCEAGNFVPIPSRGGNIAQHRNSATSTALP